MTPVVKVRIVRCPQCGTPKLFHPGDALPWKTRCVNEGFRRQDANGPVVSPCRTIFNPRQEGTA
jgi:hypothetical protein